MFNKLGNRKEKNSLINIFHIIQLEGDLKRTKQIMGF
jgi:hypothetical protein